MQSIVLKAIVRDPKKPFSGQKKAVAAELYGKDVKNQSLWVDYQEFNKVYDQAGESTVVDLVVDGDVEKHGVLISDVQTDPVNDQYRHIDFHQVKMDEEISAEVELTFIGESPAVKALGGVLVKSVDTVEVTALPADLPNEIVVDVSVIETFEDYIYAKDLKVSDKVKIELEPETVIALVAPPRSEEELSSLNEKVEMDIEKVEGMKKEEPVEAAKK